MVKKIPKNYHEAVGGDDGDEWHKAAKEEIDTFWKMKVIANEGPPPAKANVIGSRWVFDVKHDGRKRARAVAKGYTQEQGKDFDGTYAPVLSMMSFRTLLTIGALEDLEIIHLDISKAFLHGDLHHKVYMKPLPGFENPDHPDWVWELNKSVYGLCQAGREWNFVLDDHLVLVMKFERSKIDPCIYFKKNEDGTVMFLGVYVDDCKVICSRKHVEWFAKNLGERFELRNQGDISRFLGQEIIRDREKKLIFIGQQDFIKKTLGTFNMIGCKPAPTPISDKILKDVVEPMTEEEQTTMAKIPYRAAVGCLNYLVQCGRADIAVAVSSVAAFCESPRWIHWQSVKRIFRYLKGTMDYGLVVGAVSQNEKVMTLSAFSDSSFAEQVDGKSRLGYVTLLNGGITRFKTKKSSNVAQSTMEAEVFAMSECSKEIIYARELLESIGFQQLQPTLLNGDNEAALKWSVNEGRSDLTKHIRCKYYFVRECIQLNDVTVKYVESNMNMADLLTKGITQPNKFARLRMMFGITSAARIKDFHQDLRNAMDDETFNHTKEYARKGTVVVKNKFKPSIAIPINEHLTLAQVALRKIQEKPKRKAVFVEVESERSGESLDQVKYNETKPFRSDDALIHITGHDSYLQKAICGSHSKPLGSHLESSYYY